MHIWIAVRNLQWVYVGHVSEKGRRQAVAAGLMYIDGSATLLQGLGQIANNLSGSDNFLEENVLRLTAQSIGYCIAGAIGETIAGYVYDAAVGLSCLYACATLFNPSCSEIVNSGLFEINQGYGIKIGQTAKSGYGYINMFYQNPSFIKNYGVRGGTFISICDKAGKCLFRIDWDPKDGLHVQGTSGRWF